MPKKVPNYSHFPKLEANWARKRALLRAPNPSFPRAFPWWRHFFPPAPCAVLKSPLLWLHNSSVPASSLVARGTFQAVQLPPAAAPGGLAINCAVQPHLQAALPSRRGQSPWASLRPSLTLQPSNEVGHLRQTWPFNFQRKIVSVSC